MAARTDSALAQAQVRQYPALRAEMAARAAAVAAARF